MPKMRKITVLVPKRDLECAQALTGEGVSETVRIALRCLALERQYPARSKAELLELARQPLQL
jgi:hypothetical protein